MEVPSGSVHAFGFELSARLELRVHCSVLQMAHGGVWFGQPFEVCAEIREGLHVREITPTSGSPGTLVTVDGDGFRPETELWFNFGAPGQNAYSRVPVSHSLESPTRITFTVPIDADCGIHYVSLFDAQAPTEEGPGPVQTPPLPFTVTAPCDPSRRNSLDVLTYNIQMLPDEACLDLDKCHKDYRAPLIAHHPDLKGHDVIVLVEAFSDSHRRLITGELLSQYPFQGRILGKDHGTVQDGGVIILSKWRIEEEAQTIFGICNGFADCHADKGVNYARINKAGQRYHVFGTHFDSGEDRDDVSVRFWQLVLMSFFIDERGIASDEPVLMAGDFNIDRNSDNGEYERMLDMLTAAQPPIHGFRFSTNPKGQWLDYVLFSTAHLNPSNSGNLVLTPRDGAGGDLSDHYSVLGTFRFSIPDSIDLAPTASTGGPYLATLDLPLDLDGTDSWDPDGELESYLWDFGDGDLASGQAPQHVYREDGIYTVTLEVTDDIGNRALASTTVEVARFNDAPTVAVDTSGSCAADGCTVTFEAAASDPDEEDALTYIWSGCASGVGPLLTCRQASSGTVEATVLAGDPFGGKASATTAVTVYPAGFEVGAWRSCTGTGSFTCTSSGPAGCSRPGTQMRFVSETSWTLDEARAVTTPSSGQDCTESAPGFIEDYFVGPWGACSASCGGGTRSRDVFANRWKPDGPDALRPADSEACNTEPCGLTCYHYTHMYPTRSECYAAGWGVCERRYRSNGLGSIMTCWKGF